MNARSSLSEVIADDFLFCFPLPDQGEETE
jgi:hypothetical protein